MHFYVADPNDPIIRAWQGVFPTLFKPLDQMPAELQTHLRVPEELFNVQTRMYGRYHVTDPAAVLQQQRPVDRAGRHRRASRACRPRPTTSSCGCPARPRPEFLLLQPMVPSSGRT